MSSRRSFTKLSLYVGSEYILSFIISFVFFFFIFFVNQILVLAQRIMLKNVHINDVLILVTLAIPQFLMYTMPFSSLSSASMVIGNLSSQNEITAMRSNGIHIYRIFIPIVIISMFVSLGTFMIADKLIPFTAVQYRNLYAKMIQNIPTLELEDYSSTQFGNKIISNGKVDGSTIHDVIIFDNSDKKNSRVIMAEQAEISVIDINNFLYKIELENPEIFITDSSDVETFSIARASRLTLNIDLSSTASGYTGLNPSQMSLSELRMRIEEKRGEDMAERKSAKEDLARMYLRIGESLTALENTSLTDYSITMYSISNDTDTVDSIKKHKSFSLFFQYYRSELQKKCALSVACTCLVFLAFPLSFFKAKYGRLVGFGLSMFFACLYWFFLYYMHMNAVDGAVNPAIFLWIPNAVIMLLGLIFLVKLGKH